MVAADKGTVVIKESLAWTPELCELHYLIILKYCAFKTILLIKMVVELNENVLLGLAGLVFVPVFIFCVKMIIEVGNLNAKTDVIKSDIKDLKDKIISLEALERDNPVQTLRIETLQKEIEELKRRIRYYDSSLNKNKDIDN